ncbi:hypothetical protein ABPG74_006818 [Tetrahymena malaccensis]
MRFRNKEILEKITQQYRDDFIRCFLKIHKPHFDFEKFENQDCNYVYEVDFNHNSSGEEITRIKVYDNILKKQKMLIMFENLNEKELEYQKKLKTFINIFNTFPSNHIILNLYDSYQIEFFYIFEIESYDLTSKDLEIQYQIPQNDLNNLIRKKLQNFYSLLGLEKRQKKQKDLLLYINIISESQISIKFNLFDFQNQLLQQNQDDNIDDNLSPSQENFTQGSQLIIQQQNYFNQDEQEKENMEYIRKDMLQKISDCFKLEFQAIKKQDFLEQIQSKYSNMLKFHSLEIFKVIQQHPQYDNFEIYSSSQQDFSLKLTKRHTKISLVAIKFASIQEAQQMEDQYKRLFQLSGQFKSNLISTEIFTDFMSLVKENQKTIYHYNRKKSDSEESIQSIGSYYHKEDQFRIKDYLSEIDSKTKSYEEKSDLCNENSQIEYEELDDESSKESEAYYRDGFIFQKPYYYRNIVNFLKKLIDISYELIQQNIIITKIDPSKIRIKMEQIKDKKEIKIIYINNLGLKCFKQCYMKMIRLSTNYGYSNIQQYQQNYTFRKNNQIESNIDSNNQQDIENEDEINNDLIQQIGFNNVHGYNKYNIGLSICQEIQSLRMLSLSFSVNFNYEIIFKLPNFLKLSEQILWLELILETTEKEYNIFYLIDQVNNYQNINSLVIKARDDSKIKQKALKLQRLVCIEFKYVGFYIKKEVDKKLGFLL